MRRMTYAVNMKAVLNGKWTEFHFIFNAVHEIP